MGGQLGQKCLRRLLGGGNKGKKRLRNTVTVEAEKIRNRTISEVIGF